MGQFSNLDLVFKTWFPEETDYDRFFIEFYEWLNDDKKNMIFTPARKQGYYYDLCNEETVSLSNVAEYWCEHIKLNIHNGEGFVINQ